MDLKFKVTFKLGTKVLATVNGMSRDIERFQLGDVTDRVIETERYLERLLGVRVHIESGD